MAKADTPKRTAKPSKKNQYEQFQKAARDLGVDDDESAQKFEQTFAKIVPAKRAAKSS